MLGRTPMEMLKLLEAEWHELSDEVEGVSAIQSFPSH